MYGKLDDLDGVFWGIDFAGRHFVVDSPLMVQANNQLLAYFRETVTQTNLTPHAGTIAPIVPTTPPETFMAHNTPTATPHPTVTFAPVAVGPTPEALPTASSIATATIGLIFPDLANMPYTANGLVMAGTYQDGKANTYMLYYQLARQFASDSFAGKEEVAHYATSDTVRTVNITIPRNVTLDFLQSILQIPIVKGKNIPTTSDAGNILNLDVGPLHFYTITQNKNIFEFDDTHTWILTCDGRSFVINSPKMQQSLDKLKPYMYGTP